VQSGGTEPVPAGQTYPFTISPARETFRTQLAAMMRGMDFAFLKFLLPLFVTIALFEAFWLQRKRGRYDWLQSGASLAIALGQQFSAMLAAALMTGIFAFAYSHRLWDLRVDSLWMLGLLFLCIEFAYYWHHRLSHECRWFWASHAVHHSPNEYNLSAAYRLSWTSGISGHSLVYLPLIWAGFAPKAVFGMLALNLAYQFWLHTELVPRLGPFEWLFNTPSHHRVHHASNPEYIDRNYGGTLIIFDRLFGTFAAEHADAPCRYGLTEPLLSANPLRIVFHGWIGLWRDLQHAKTWRKRLYCLFGPPGWSPVAPNRLHMAPHDATLRTTPVLSHPQENSS
jgi:sterol desaturase/sphingolipid hydroxylase (fatty acid hydroxylase superfamily)